jgi:hypothetical protein
VSERRQASRPGPRERRSFPRPPLWLNFVLLLIAAASFAWARHQRTVIETKSAILFAPTPTSPAELDHIRQELAEMDVTEGQLARELDARMKYIESLQGDQFYISIDSARKKMQFRLGKDVVREADVAVGEAKTVQTRDRKKSWTFVPLKGGFTVVGKEVGYDWQVPGWASAMNGEMPAQQGRVVPDGLGKYVIFLPDNYIIHSPPAPGSPLQGPKPGSFMVPEADLAAIWPRVTTQTRVYIF